MTRIAYIAALFTVTVCVDVWGDGIDRSRAGERLLVHEMNGGQMSILSTTYNMITQNQISTPCANPARGSIFIKMINDITE